MNTSMSAARSVLGRDQARDIAVITSSYYPMVHGGVYGSWDF